MGEEQRGIAAHRAQAAVMHRLHPRAGKFAAGDRLEVEGAAAASVRSMREELRMDLLPHLIAAGAGPGPDRGRQRTARAKLSYGRDARCDDPPGETAPAGMDHGHRAA